jgi:hypothetical protein
MLKCGEQFARRGGNDSYAVVAGGKFDEDSGHFGAGEVVTGAT